MASTYPALFQPIKIGDLSLSHRVVLAPSTRYKATKTGHVPIVSLMKEYYAQRSSTPGTLLIAEATIIAPKAGGSLSTPGIWNGEQIRAWKEITDEVHLRGSYIFLQLYSLGRTMELDALQTEHLTCIAPSAIPIPSSPVPIPQSLTVEEIKEHIELYAEAARNAVEKAGFDGVELHGANGYLIDQFTQDVSNHRLDRYGGGIEARCTFALEVIDAVVNAVGPQRTAFRLSPWSPFNGMTMVDPIPQFTHLVKRLKEIHPNLAYLHLIEPRIVGNDDRVTAAHESNDFIRDIWKPLPLIVAGGYSREAAIETAEVNGDLVAFGRFYISNPDLPRRLRLNIPLTRYDRKTFFVRSFQDNFEAGYIDYPFASDDKEPAVLDRTRL